MFLHKLFMPCGIPRALPTPQARVPSVGTKRIVMAHFLTLTPVDDVLAHIAEYAPLPTQRVPLHDAFSRVLAEPFHAPEDLPGFTRSTMDGFAVRAKDVFGASEGLPALLQYMGECPMGETPSISLEPGQTARIWTGGMLPAGADAVVMLEYAREPGSGLIELTRPVAPGENVITPTEDAAKGALLLSAGRKLRSQELGLLAALGQEEVAVYSRPKVAIISTGDEVIPVSETPRPGQVRNVNSATLSALALGCGAEVRSFGLVGDNPALLEQRVAEAFAWADVLLLSGGSSAGQRDHTLAVLQSLPGATLFAHGVAISPGKPLIVYRAGNKALWGLPGHAASALVCAQVFIRPLLHTMQGLAQQDHFALHTMQATLTRPVPSAQGRRDYIRVALSPPTEPGGLMQARPIRGKSGLITTLVQADALVVCHESEEGLRAGQVVPIWLLP